MRRWSISRSNAEYPIQLYTTQITHPLGLPSLCGILMETAFSNVDWRTSSVALNAKLLTTRVLHAAPVATGREKRNE